MYQDRNDHLRLCDRLAILQETRANRSTLCDYDCFAVGSRGYPRDFGCHPAGSHLNNHGIQRFAVSDLELASAVRDTNEVDPPTRTE